MIGIIKEFYKRGTIMIHFSKMDVNKFEYIPPRPLSNIFRDYGALRNPSGASTGSGSVLEPTKNDIVDEINRQTRAAAAAEEPQDE